MTQVLQGKVAVITGGTRGFGLAVARAYAAEGAAVVISGRTAQAVEAAVAGLTAEGAQASGLRADVAEAAQVQTLAAFALQKHGRFDVWVNNAGSSAPFGPTFAASPDEFERIVRTNILGLYHGTRAALEHFLPRRAGKLINVLGRGARSPAPLQNAYASSKAWVRLVHGRAGEGVCGERRGHLRPGPGHDAHRYAPSADGLPWVRRPAVRRVHDRAAHVVAAAGGRRSQGRLAGKRGHGRQERANGAGHGPRCHACRLGARARSPANRPHGREP